MSFEITGTVVEVSEREFVKGRNGDEYAKQSVVIEYGDQFKRTVEVEFFGKEDKFPRELPDVNPLQRIMVRANPVSRFSERHGRWFTKLEGWYLKIMDRVDQPSADRPEPPPVTSHNDYGAVDEIPF